MAAARSVASTLRHDTSRRAAARANSRHYRQRRRTVSSERGLSDANKLTVSSTSLDVRRIGELDRHDSPPPPRARSRPPLVFRRRLRLPPSTVADRRRHRPSSSIAALVNSSLLRRAISARPAVASRGALCADETKHDQSASRRTFQCRRRRPPLPIKPRLAPPNDCLVSHVYVRDSCAQ